jgi:glutathione peroxidase
MSFYDLGFTDSNGTPVNFEQFRGRVCLVVNIASECGYASQLHDLQTLYLLYGGRGFDVLAFPSNDFGKQEPKGDNEIAPYCASEYLVTFPVFRKSHVKGPEMNEVFRFINNQPGPFPLFRKPLWNFQKYLIDRRGRLADVFLPGTSPRSLRFRKALDRCLEEATEDVKILQRP